MLACFAYMYNANQTIFIIVYSYSFDADPSHLPFAHHNIISNRNQAAYIDINIKNISRNGFDSEAFYPKRKPISPASSFTTTTENYSKPSVLVPQYLHFRPPNLLYQVINLTEVRSIFVWSSFYVYWLIMLLILHRRSTRFLFCPRENEWFVSWLMRSPWHRDGRKSFIDSWEITFCFLPSCAGLRNGLSICVSCESWIAILYSFMAR